MSEVFLEQVCGGGLCPNLKRTLWFQYLSCSNDYGLVGSVVCRGML